MFPLAQRLLEDHSSGLLTAITLAELSWIVGLTFWIVMEKRHPVATLAWVLVLSFLPIVGIPFYLLMGPRRLARKRLRAALSRKAVSTDMSPRVSHLDLRSSPLSRQLMRMTHQSGEAPATRAKGLTLYTDGDACYRAQLEAIAAAKHHVHVYYYIFYPDRVGERFRDALTERAKAGVEVRVLVDAIGSSSLSRRFLAPLIEAGAEVDYFNEVSFARFHPRLMNFRSHRKILIVDGEVGFTGGMNICEDHSATYMDKEAWRDTHLRIEGAAPVHWLQLIFLGDWHFTTGSVPPAERYLHPAEPVGEHCVQIVGSGPDEDIHPIHKLFFASISGATERVWITTPYFIPDDPLLTALSTASLRGVDVRLLVPRQSDSRLATAACGSYFEEILECGVRIYEYLPSMLHAKTLLVDDIGFVGTANMDNRSFRLNFELLAVIYGGPIVEELTQVFEADLEKSHEVTRRTLRKKNLFGRVLEASARLFAPLL